MSAEVVASTAPSVESITALRGQRVTQDSDQTVLGRLILMLSFFFAGSICVPVMAGVARDISNPVFVELQFSKDAVVMVTQDGIYKINRKPGVSEPISFSEMKTNFISPSGAKRAQNEDQDHWVMPVGSPFFLINAYCGEGTENHHKLTRDGKPIVTYLPACETISALEVINHELWLGAIKPGELSNVGGSGVSVVSLKTGKPLVKFVPGTDLADGYVQLIQRDPITNDIWIVTNSALHRVRNHKVVDRWYLSEQFSKTGQATYFLSEHKQRNDPWAILVRTAGITDSQQVWQQLQSHPKNIKRLRFLYNEEGGFFLIDDLRPGSQYQLVKPEFRLVPPAWPSEFGWLIEPLIASLSQVHTLKNRELSNKAYQAARLLCTFKDPRIGPFIQDWERIGGMTTGHKYLANLCIGKQRSIGMLVDTSYRDTALWSRVELELNHHLVGLPLNSAYSSTYDFMSDLDSIADQNLKAFLVLINAIIKKAPASQHLDDLLDHILGRFGDNEDTLPLARSWLLRVQGNSLSRLCQYFNPKYHATGSRNSIDLTHQLIVATDREWLVKNALAKRNNDPIDGYSSEVNTNCKVVVKQRLARSDHQQFETIYGQQLSATEREYLK